MYVFCEDEAVLAVDYYNSSALQRPCSNTPVIIKRLILILNYFYLSNYFYKSNKTVNININYAN